MSASAQGVFNTLANKDAIPRISTVVAETQQILSDSKSTAAQVTEALRKEPVIASELIGLASLQAKGNKVKTIEHAIVYLGRQRVSDLLIAATIKTIKFKTKIYSESTYWRDAILIGKITEALSKRFLNTVSDDEAYLAGSMCNIGKVVGALTEPEAVDRVYMAVIDVESGMPWKTAENALFATPHSLLGEIAAALWGVPVFVREAIVEHNGYPTKDQPISIGQLVGLAEQLAHLVRGNPLRVHYPILAALSTAFGVTEELRSQIVGQFQSQFSKL